METGSKKEKTRALARNWQKTKRAYWVGKWVGKAATAAGEERHDWGSSTHARDEDGDEYEKAACGLAPPATRPGTAA